MDTVTRHAARAWLRAAVLLVVGIPLGLATAPDLAAQENQEKDNRSRIVPTNHAVLTGYGTVGWFYRSDDENAFTASFNPIFLYQFLDRFLFEVEFEFELQGGVTETGLEYAQLDYVATDNLTLVGGKFLLPFNVFGERLHPTWINKFPTAPPIYGHHVADFGAEPLLPILSDVGVMARATVAPGRWLLSANVYGVQGPAFEEDEEGGNGEDEEELLEIEFPGSSGDNNKNKALGLRLDFALPPWAEVNFSFFNGDYDDEGVLDFTAYGVAAEMHRGAFEARGEFIQTRQEIETETGFPSVVRNGFYAQAAYRLGSWEPLFRWTQVFDTELEGETENDGARQAAFGLNYWLSPSIAVMAGYELNKENGFELDNSRFIIHVAFGF